MSRSEQVRGAPAMSASAIVSGTVEGSHVLKVQGYSRIKKLGNSKSIDSETFDVGGHRWFIRYYPDGDDSTNAGWISLYLYLQHSNASNVEASFKFSLLDEMGEPVPSYSRSSSEISFKTSEPGWGYEKFIDKKSLEESTYLKDDCFHVRCDFTVSKEITTEAITQYVVVPPPDMHEHLGRLLSSKERADVRFEAELFGPMRENTMANIRIDGMEARVFKAVLDFFYTDMLPEIEKDDMVVMAQHLLVAADRYNLERLKLICEDKLCNLIDTSTVATTLTLAEQHGCLGLKQACFNFLKSPSNLKVAVETDGFVHLVSSCPSLVMELVAKVARFP
ncbi:hypothetical protein ACP70R_007673 [Stipagrostis hirtigluma subsp. patula]